MSRSLPFLLSLLVGACDPAPDPGTDPIDTAEPPEVTDVAVLEGLWVGTQIDVLTHVDHQADQGARGDCEDGTESLCDSVAVLDDQGVPVDATADALQFETTTIDRLYRATGSEIPDDVHFYALATGGGQALALLEIAPSGDDTRLVVHMKNRYDEDPRIPDELYDATRLDGHTYTGRTFTFDASGDPLPPSDDATLTVASEAADAFTFTGDGRIGGAAVSGTRPTLAYDDTALDGWVGVHRGVLTPPSAPWRPA